MNNLELNRYTLWTLRIQAGRKDGRKIVSKLLLFLLLLMLALTYPFHLMPKTPLWEKKKSKPLPKKGLSTDLYKAG